MSTEKKKNWTMPQWMEKYRPFFNNTGGNSIEKLINGKSADVFTNAPLALIQMSVESQVALLQRLHEKEIIQ